MNLLLRDGDNAFILLPTMRRPLTPGKRFRVLARDQYVCQYCGAQPPNVTLVVDHVIPVKEGGSDSEDNLIAACVACNSGKAAKRLERIAPTPTSTARLARERRNMIKAAALANDAAQAIQDLQQSVVEVWCEIRGTERVDRSTLSVMVHYAKLYGLETVGDWIVRATMRFPCASDRKIGRYVSGIRRSKIEQGTLIS